jgi:hypothetical protein
MMIVVAIVAPVIKTSRQAGHKHRHHTCHQHLLDPGPHLTPPVSDQCKLKQCLCQSGTEQIVNHSQVLTRSASPGPGKKVVTTEKITRITRRKKTEKTSCLSAQNLHRRKSLSAVAEKAIRRRAPAYELLFAKLYGICLASLMPWLLHELRIETSVEILKKV